MFNLNALPNVQRVFFIAEMSTAINHAVTKKRHPAAAKKSVGRI
jgi:hypothetical protein